MELKIKALSPKIGTDIPLPRFATAGAACMDLCVSLANTRSHMPSLTVPPSTLASFSSMYFRTDTEPCSSVMSKLRHHWPGLRRW